MDNIFRLKNIIFNSNSTFQKYKTNLLKGNFVPAHVRLWALTSQLFPKREIIYLSDLLRDCN